MEMTKRNNLRHFFILSILIVLSLSSDLAKVFAIEKVVEKDPVTISVVVVNPSAEKTQTIPVKIDLPQEVTPDGVIDNGGLILEYDDKRSLYFLYDKEVELKPKETKVFTVLVKDVWNIQKSELNQLRAQADAVLKKLKDSEYYDSAKAVVDSINQRLDAIDTTQSDESVTQKRRIGNYRNHLLILQKIRQDIAELEKLLQFKGGVPIPEMLEESKLKSDAPSTKTTWLIIIVIMAFLGMVGGQFFYTWHKRAKAEQDFEKKRKEKLPGSAS